MKYIIKKNFFSVLYCALSFFCVITLSALSVSAEDFKSLLARAEKGDVSAMVSVGKAYEFGTNVGDLAPEKAFEWYSKAAKTGDAKGQYNLGNMYMLGIGVEQRDAKVANEWFEKAANQGYVPAIYNLAVNYLYAHGGEYLPEKAFEMLQDTADKRFLDAQYALASVYIEGKIVEKDLIKAQELLETAANAGHRDAQLKLAQLYVGDITPTADVDLLSKSMYWVLVNQKLYGEDSFNKSFYNALEGVFMSFGKREDIAGIREKAEQFKKTSSWEDS